MKKKLILIGLFLFSKSIFCMVQENNNDVVIDFGEETDEKAVDADKLLDSSANEVDLESGLQFKDFYNEKDKKIKGLLFYIINRTGIKRTHAMGSHNDVMASYVCTIANNLEKLSEHMAADAKDEKELAEKNFKLIKKKYKHDLMIALIASGLSVAAFGLTLHNM